MLAPRHLRECAACGRQTSVTAGTIMDHTRVPLTLWFWSAYLVATHTPGISAVQLRRHLGIGRCETAWLILHSLRRAMIAPERGLLTGEAGGDEGFADGRNPARRCGRDRTGKALVAMAAEVRRGDSGRVRLQVLPNANRDTLPGFVQATVTPAAIVHTDGWSGYGYLKAVHYDHRPISQHYLLADRKLILPRAHRATSNLKTWIAGTHRTPPSSTCRSTSTSSPSGTTAAASPWPPSGPCPPGHQHPPTTHREITT